jgi:HD-GYP domain-containing protein (c-di-GMP phosphodiesterase class II)
MHIVPIEEARPGMRLARSIYHQEDGTVLFKVETELQESCIERIKAMKYGYLYILSHQRPAVEWPHLEPIREETRIRAEVSVSHILRRLERSEEADFGKLQALVTQMTDEVLQDRRIVYNLFDVRSHNGHIFSHSVNVGVISLMIGAQMGLNRSELESLGLGALMHDAGKMLVDSSLLNKPDRFSLTEYERIKRHPSDGCELLHQYITGDQVPARIALEHHEREDGSGYPRSLRGTKIHLFTKIVAVADVYDAMTSHRVYRRPIPSHKALVEIREDIGHRFDRAVVEELCKTAAPYPVGSQLLLQNGDKALVVSNYRGECRISLLSGKRRGAELSLDAEPALTVVERLA